MRSRISLASAGALGALLLLGVSVALIWVAWLPIDPRAECGWTCYVPLGTGLASRSVGLRLTEVSGGSVAPVAVVLLIAATTLTLLAALVPRRLPRVAPVLALVTGLAGLVATAAAIARVLRSDFILVVPDQSGSTKIGEASLGTGAVLAIVVGVGVCLASVIMLRTRRPPARSGTAAPAERAALAAPPA